jgi:hypothetical protein
VTTVLDTAAAATPAPSAVGRSPRARIALAVLPWLLPAVVLLVALLDTGTPARDIGLYAAYFALAVVTPGTLVHRAMRGSRGNLPEDLGLGAATGLLLLLVGWALAAATGLQVLLPAWPLLIIVLFLAVPGLRRHWRIAEPRPLPLRWSWIIAGALVVLVAMSYPGWIATPLPPVETYYYQDMLYHLALVHEMTRSMPFEVPQVAGDVLRYHYLSDADMAVGSMITRIEPATILFRLWVVPTAGVAIFVVAALARELSGKWWAGALGGATAVLALPMSLGAAAEAFGGTAVNSFSPSQTYAYPLLGLLLALAFDVLRARPLRWAWTLVFPLALACAGAKSSVLPPLVAGLFLAGLVVLIRYRDRLLALAAFGALTLAAMLAGLKIFAGGGAGTLAVQPFALLWWFPPYRQTLGENDLIDGTRALPLGVEKAGFTGLVFLAGLVVWWVVTQAPRLVGLLAIGTRPTRSDPIAWLLAGLTAAGAGAAWVFWHPAASQVYFYASVIPFAALLSVWFLAEHTRHWRPVVAGLLAGGIWAAVAPGVKAPADPTLRGWAWTLAVPLLRTAVVALVVAAIGLVVWRLTTGRLAWRALPVALVAAILGAGLGGQIDGQIRVNHEVLTDGPAPLTDSQRGRIILKDEVVAALWLEKHSGRDDIVATNVHCLPLNWKSACDARAFFVAGFGGRRTLVESWGYTDEAVAKDGVNGKRFPLQPPPHPERFALNQRVFAQGDPADVAELRRRYDVRWLYADTRAIGGVSPRLAESARLRFTAGPVAIYYLG